MIQSGVKSVPQGRVQLKFYLSLTPKVDANRNIVIGSVSASLMKPTNAVSPGTVIMEVHVDIDPAIFEFPKLEFALNAPEINPELIMKELKEWTSGGVA